MAFQLNPLRRNGSRSRGSILVEPIEPRLLFSFVLSPTSNDVYAEALASFGALVSQSANPASATDSSNGGKTSSTAHGNYTASDSQITLHADSTETSANDSFGDPGYAQSEAIVHLNFSVAAPTVIAISVNLSLADAGGGSQPQGLGLNYAGGLAVFNEFANQPTTVPTTLTLQPGDYQLFADSVAYYNLAAGTKSSTADITITVTATLPTGTAPQITSANAATFPIGQFSDFTVTTSGDPTPSIHETAFLPDGISFVDNGDGTATLSGIPAPLDATGNYDLIVTASNSTQPDANQFFTLTLTKSSSPVAVPTHLVFGTNPASTTAGATFAPLTVLVEDKFNHVVDTDNSSVTLSLAGTVGGVLHGTGTVQAVNGVATFSDLSITKAGAYTLNATDSSLKAAKSKRFVISPDLASAHMVVSTASLGSVLVGKFLPAFSATLFDQFGNLITTLNAGVSLVVAGGPLDASIKGPQSIHFAHGTATFKKIWIEPAGNYSLQLSAPALPVAGSLSSLMSLTVTQATSLIIPPHAAHAYKSSANIPLKVSLKSNAPAVIPFTGIATISDQNQNILGSAAVSSHGVISFVLSGVDPGVYTCTISYPGDANHTAASSLPFTLNVTA